MWFLTGMTKSVFTIFTIKIAIVDKKLQNKNKNKKICFQRPYLNNESKIINTFYVLSILLQMQFTEAKNQIHGL